MSDISGIDIKENPFRISLNEIILNTNKNILSQIRENIETSERNTFFTKTHIKNEETLDRTRIRLQKITPEISSSYWREITELMSQLTSESIIDMHQYKMLDYFKSLENNSTQTPIYFITYKGGIIGIVKVIYERKIIHGFSSVAHIEDFIIHSKYRGFGFGKLVMKMIVNHAKNGGCYKVILNCNDNVKEFYEKCGFTQKNHQMAIYF